MNRELELVETMDKLSFFIENFQSQLLKGDLSGYTLRQLYYIELVNKYSNISISEIAKLLDVQKSTVSIAINQLIEQGIVTKIQSNIDKRVFCLQLTSKGKELMEIHAKVHKNAIKKILNILAPEEVDNFIKIVNKIDNIKN